MCEALKIAMQALRERRERENPQPLTAEELKQINGEPVYIVQELGGSEWLFRRGCGFIDMYGDFTDDDETNFETYGLLWIAYLSKPKEEQKDG
jgi:hypothetical protein